MVNEFLARAFVEEAEARGIRFMIEQGQLHTRAPRGAIDADMAATIRTNKPMILAWLADRPPPVPTTRRRLGPRSGDGPAPLSMAQERFWFIDRLSGRGAQYNLPGALRIRGAFDVDLAARALQASIDRHETMRVVYRQDGEDGSLRQVPVADARLDVGVHDLRNFADELREPRLLEHVHANASTPFDLSADLMLRASLVRLAEEESVLLLCMPHIASDGWSMRVLEREFVARYVAMRDGGEADIPPLAVTYGDYAAWQRERLHDPDVARQLGYWERTLRDAPAVHGLPLDRPRRADSEHPAARFGFMLDRSLHRGLKGLAYDANATVFMLLHAAFALTIARHSGSSDVVLGTPVMNRLEQPLEALVGCFVNTLALRVRCPSRGTFREFLAHVRDVNLDAQANQDVTFDQVVDRLHPERSMLHAPVFQVMLSMGMPRNGTSRGVPGLDIRFMEHVATVAKFDVSFYAEEQGDDLFFGVEYDADLFDAASMERLASHFVTVLEQVTASPDLPLSTLELMPASARERVSAWETGPTRSIPDGSVDEAFEAQARARPEAVALVVDGCSYGYGALNAQANRLAHRLRSWGVGEGVSVGICLPRSVELAVAILAVWKAAGAYVPLDPANPAARLQAMCEDAQVCRVVGTMATLASLELPAAQQLALDGPAWLAEQDSVPADDVARPQATPAGRLAYVLFTSGSSGRPKGVRVTHGNVMNLAVGLDVALEAIGARGALRWAWNASYGFDASLQALVQWRHGATLHLLSNALREDPVRLRRYLDAQAIDVLDATPLQVEALLDVDGPPLPSLVVGGEAIGAPLWQRIGAHHAGGAGGALNVYGPTETTVDATWARIEGGVPRIGRPLANVCCVVLDAWGRAQPEGVAGELYIGGAGVAQGYVGRDAETAARFVRLPGREGVYYRSGDRVRWDGEGRLDYLGRLDGQVKLRGYRIEPEEVAGALREVSGAAATVVARTDGGTTRLVGYVAGGTATPDWEADVLAGLRLRLPAYMLPWALVRLDRLPTTANGKIDVHALPAPVRRSTSSGLPLRAAQRLVADIWCRYLGIDRIGIDDNFFELGGQSLLAARTAARVGAAFGIEVPLRVFFEGGTVRALTVHVDAAIGTDVADAIAAAYLEVVAEPSHE